MIIEINCSSAGATHNREPLRGASQARAVHATRAYSNRGLRSFHSLTPGCKLSPFQGCTASYKFTAVSESCNLSPFQGFTASYKFTAVSESCKLSPIQGCTSPYGFSNDERPLKTSSLLSLLSLSSFTFYAPFFKTLTITYKTPIKNPQEKAESCEASAPRRTHSITRLNSTQ